jgi:ribosomal protein S18 acetylase RimI-like enzyme
MHSIEDVLNRGTISPEPFYLRHHEPGDIGWVIHQHGLVYREEYGWDERFEASVAQTCADFISEYNPQKERCWIAEINGERVGSVLCTKHTDETARLSLLLVAPQARELGLGTRLIEECIRFAKGANYQKVTLRTQDVLVDARKIFEKIGFQFVNEEAHHSYGQDLAAQNWDLIL